MLSIIQLVNMKLDKTFDSAISSITLYNIIT